MNGLIGLALTGLLYLVIGIVMQWFSHGYPEEIKKSIEVEGWDGPTCVYAWPLIVIVLGWYWGEALLKRMGSGIHFIIQKVL